MKQLIYSPRLVINFYASNELSETSGYNPCLFCFLGSVLSPAISACVEYLSIVQRLKPLLYKDCVNTNLTICNKIPVCDSSPANPSGLVGSPLAVER